MSIARLIFPSRLELNRREGSFNAAPLANVILTQLLWVSPVQTMPSWDQTGLPHFPSSTISGSALRMISRTFASVFPRQSPSPRILSSINAEADAAATGFFMYCSNFTPNLTALTVTCNDRERLCRFLRDKPSNDMAFPHPQSRKKQHRKKAISNGVGVIGSI